MAKTNCPTLRHITNDDQCLENFAGLGAKAYIFIKDDLKAPLVATKNVYTFPEDAFKENCGFYAVELKENSQSITGESQGKRKGFKQTGQLVIEVVNEAVSELLRGLNNLDWGYIVADGDDKWQIMYSKSQKITLDSGALKTETGAQASDDRVSTLAPTLENALYPCCFVSFPEGVSPDDMLATA